MNKKMIIIFKIKIDFIRKIMYKFKKLLKNC
jgi:hypothetical protein